MAVLAMRGPSAAENPAGGSDNRRDIASADSYSSEQHRIGDDTCCPVTGVAVVNPINVAVTGAAMVNNTERLVYFNKVRGVLRLMDCCVPTTSASASETTVDEG